MGKKIISLILSRWSRHHDGSPVGVVVNGRKELILGSVEGEPQQRRVTIYAIIVALFALIFEIKKIMIWTNGRQSDPKAV